MIKQTFWRIPGRIFIIQHIGLYTIDDLQQSHL